MLALWTSQYSTVQLQYTWKVSKAKWINDVPGCNKTFWIVEQFNVDTATVVTCTMEVRIGHWFLVILTITTRYGPSVYSNYILK